MFCMALPLPSSSGFHGERHEIVARELVDAAVHAAKDLFDLRSGVHEQLAPAAIAELALEREQPAVSRKAEERLLGREVSYPLDEASRLLDVVHDAHDDAVVERRRRL